MSDYTPKPEHKFTFGLWTVGNRGADPFGTTVREKKSPADRRGFISPTLTVGPDGVTLLEPTVFY